MLLVIETALASLSVAMLGEDGAALASCQEQIGRGHAEALLPMVAAVMAASGVSRPSAILVSVGPGSFTGMRVGIAAARALGLAWDVPVTGTTATALIAAAAFAADPALRNVAAVVDAGRGQVCLEQVDRDDWRGGEALASMSPEVAAGAAAGVALAGPAADLVAAFGLSPVAHRDWPHATDAWLVPLTARSLPPLPRYVRPPDAKLPL